MFLDSGTIYLESCNLHDNNAKNNGGAIAQVKEAALDLWFTYLENNVANHEGGAVASHQGGTMVIYLSIFDSNMASALECNCNAFYKDGSSGSIIIYNSTFLPVTSAYPFSIEYNSTNATALIIPPLDNGFLSYLVVMGCGSILRYLSDIDIELSDQKMQLCSNRVYTIYHSVMSVVDSNFTSNVYTSGGAINANDCVITLNACNFISNHVYEDGGALELSTSSVAVNHCTLRKNMAGNNGGGIFAIDSSVSITRSAVSNNSCDYNGAGSTHS